MENINCSVILRPGQVFVMKCMENVRIMQDENIMIKMMFFHLKNCLLWLLSHITQMNNNNDIWNTPLVPHEKLILMN